MKHKPPSTTRKAEGRGGATRGRAQGACASVIAKQHAASSAREVPPLSVICKRFIDLVDALPLSELPPRNGQLGTDVQAWKRAWDEKSSAEKEAAVTPLAMRTSTLIAAVLEECRARRQQQQQREEEVAQLCDHVQKTHLAVAHDC